MNIQRRCDSSRATWGKHVLFLCVLGINGSSTEPPLVILTYSRLYLCLDFGHSAATGPALFFSLLKSLLWRPNVFTMFVTSSLSASLRAGKISLL